MTNPRPDCRHGCGKPSLLGKRGLCGFCYSNPDIRKLYRCLPMGRKGKLKLCLGEDSSANLTEAELDALIAAQMPTMPADPRSPRIQRAGKIRRMK